MKKAEFSEDIVKEVLSNYDLCRQQRSQLELQWRLNMNFLNGNQYCEISPLGDISDYGKQYFWQEREVYNHIAPIIDTRIAKLGRVKTNLSVRPFSNDDSDVYTAKISTQIIKSVIQNTEFKEKFNLGVMWSEVAGSIFYKIEWDINKGRVLGEKKGKIIKDGDISITLCPPYEIFPDDVSHSTIEDCNFILHARAYHIEEIRALWGIDVSGQAVEVFSLNQSNVCGGLGYNASVPSVSTQKAENFAMVIEKYVKPCLEYPNGRLIIIAGDKLVYLDELPYENGINGDRTYPFIRQMSIQQVGNFYGVSIIERIIPVQRAYNSIKNRKLEYLNRLTMGVVAVEDGSIDIDTLEEEGISPGKVIVYRQGCNPPKALDFGNVPPDFVREEERLLSEFILISGVSEFMRYGKVPNNVVSGIALSLLQEQDDTRITITAESIRNCVKNVSIQALRLAKQFIKSKRLLKIAGDNGEVENLYFTSSDLTSEDVVFDTENELTETPASRKSMVFDLIKLGLMNDESGKISARTKTKIMEMLGFGNWEASRDIDEAHRRKAQKENLDIDNAIDFVEVDNHNLHIEEHTKAIIDGTIINNDKNIMLEHIRQHKKNQFEESINEQNNETNRM